jgi:hypothetical protein
MNRDIRYTLTMRRGETRQFELPDFRSSWQILKYLSVESDRKTYDIKLIGKETICSYGEAVFYHTSKFDLSDKMPQIADAEKIKLVIRNITDGKDSSTPLTIGIVLTYVKTPGSLIFNNTYVNLNPEGLATIIDDIIKSGKHLSKVIMTSPNKLNLIELKPQFESDPLLLKPIKLSADCQNHVILDFEEMESNGQFEYDVQSSLKYYNICVSENIEKIGILVYGYVN